MMRGFPFKILLFFAALILIIIPPAIIYIFSYIEETVYSAERNLINATVDTFIALIDTQFNNLYKEKYSKLLEIHRRLINWTNTVIKILEKEGEGKNSKELIERIAATNEVTFILFNEDLLTLGMKANLPPQALEKAIARLKIYESLFLKLNDNENPALIYARKPLNKDLTVMAFYPLTQFEEEFKTLYSQALENIKNTISSLKIEERGYIVLISGKSESFLAHPDPRFDGKPVPLEPERNRNLMQIIRELAKSGGELFQYLWYADQGNKVVSKLALVKYYEPLDWYVVGTIYEEDLRKVIRKYKTLASLLLVIGSLGVLTLSTMLTQRLRENMRKLRLTWETAGVGMVSCNESTLQIEETNRYFENIVKKSEKEITGRMVTEFVHPQDRATLMEHLKGTPHKALEEVQVRLLNGEGEITHAIIRSSRIKERKTILLSITDITKIIELQRDLERANEILQRLSSRDHLTGAFNRRSLESMLEEELKRAKDMGEPLSIIMLDIDHFKRINDTHGHLVGDHILKGLTKLLTLKLRLEDNLFRYGGEEFIILLLKTGKKEAVGVAERLRKEVESHEFSYRSKSEAPLKIKITCSFGVSTFPEDGDTGRELIAKADEALYRAKKNGRNRVEPA